MHLEIIPKHSHGYLSKHLNAREICCSCHNENCFFSVISIRLIEKFELLRHDVGVPLHVNSGFRCKEWNGFVGGAVKSKHQCGCAIDIAVPKGWSINQFHKAAWKIFDKVISYKRGNFIHCSIDFCLQNDYPNTSLGQA